MGGKGGEGGGCFSVHVHVVSHGGYTVLAA